MAMDRKQTIENSYRYCETLARNHYENFPVASFFLPKKIRRPIAVIYAFARSADDIADEGFQSAQQRLAALNQYGYALTQIQQSMTQNRLTHQHTAVSSEHPHLSMDAALPDNSIVDSDMTENNMEENPIFIALQEVIQEHQLPLYLFFDLLKAFKQDIVKTEYEDFEDLLKYCRLSANPVGRILLHLTKNDTHQNLLYSDSFCTSLQLVNFLQDLHEDLHKRDRCYLPRDEMRFLGLTKQTLLQGKNDTAIKQLIKTQLDRAHALLNEGSHLTEQLNGLFGLEIRFIMAGAKQMLSMLYQRKSVYTRVTLSFRHVLSLFYFAFFHKSYRENSNP